MNIPINFTETKRVFSRWTLGVAAAAALLSMTMAVHAEAPAAMAPPVQVQDAAYTGDSAPAGQNVFNWAETPKNQEVDITRAVFDEGGYQLYDTAGETIVVPFTDQNLYVMKFARSTTDQMYFINEGDAPVLYVPDNGYLENASAPGSRWYPFPKDFQPEQPVYLGIAPSWPAFVDMGWYPDMFCWGGYYCDSPFLSGAVFLPTIGFFFEFGGHRFHNFNDFHRYCQVHPAPYRMGNFHRGIYGLANHRGMRQFGAAGGAFQAHRGFQGARTVGNTQHAFLGTRTALNRRGSFQGTRASVNTHRTFLGGSFPARRAFHGAGASFDTHGGFQGTGSPSYSPRAFRGAGGPSYSPRTFSGAGGPSYSPRTFSGAGRPTYSPRTFSSAGGPSYSPRTFQETRPAITERGPIPAGPAPGGNPRGGGEMGNRNDRR